MPKDSKPMSMAEKRRRMIEEQMGYAEETVKPGAVLNPGDYKDPVLDQAEKHPENKKKNRWW